MIRRPPRSTLFPTRRSSDRVQRGDGTSEPGDGRARRVRGRGAETCGERARRGGGGRALAGNGGPCSATVEITQDGEIDRKSTRLNSSHAHFLYAVFCSNNKL